MNGGGTILVAGGTGHLGREVVRVLADRGYRIHLLTRRGEIPESLVPLVAEVHRGDLRDPVSLLPAVSGVETVFSCAGASLDLNRWSDRTTFESIDYQGNLELLRVAMASGVRHFGYVSVFHSPKLARDEYVSAHERFVAELRRSPLRSTVIRPTGYFSFFGELLGLARRGPIPLIFSGTARTNPIHEADLAVACVDAVEHGRSEVSVGGPETLSRRQIAELAFEALDRPARVINLPRAVFASAAAGSRVFNPRLGAVIRFGAAVSRLDCIAPPFGIRRLSGYFADLASRTSDG